jgi:nicotinamidase-related amidase
MDVLLIIDMQEASFQNSDKYDQPGVIDRINLLSNHVRKNSGKVIFIQHDGTKEEGLEPHSRGWEILSNLNKGANDIIIRKTANDAFCGTNLNMTIEKMSVSRVVVSGWATDFCVDTTIRSAVSKGLNVVVISDCHTCSDRPHLKAEQVIKHHNWLWNNLISIGNTIEVLPLSDFFRKNET